MSAIPVCMPPDPNTKTPKYKAPPKACDAHCHIFGPGDQYPYAPDRSYTPPDAPLERFIALQKTLGLERAVLVNASCHGSDNTVILDAIGQSGGRYRGVANVDAGITDAELERLTKLGIRGIRFFMLPGGALPWEILHRMADRVGAFGWHVQLQLDGRELPERESVLKQIKGTLVIDHVGKFLEPVPIEHAAFAVLRGLLDNGRTWVKLSAPYEVSKSGPPFFDDVGTLAKVLAGQAPDRMVWATNWPHPMSPANRKPDDAMLLDMLLDWVPDEAARKKVLVDNPAQLYGY